MEGSIVFPAWPGRPLGRVGSLQERLRPHEILSTARALVIDAEKNISPKPSSGFYDKISTPAFLLFPKVKTDKDLGSEK